MIQRRSNFAHRGTLTQPPAAAHSADAIIMREMRRTHAPGKQSAPGVKTLEGSPESARASSRGAALRLCHVKLQRAPSFPPRGRALCLANICRQHHHASNASMQLSAKDSASAMKTFQGHGELHGLWVEVCLLCIGLTAGPAAKDVDATEDENDGIETCQQSDKTRGSGPGAPRSLFPIKKKRAPEMVNSKCRLSYFSTTVRPR